MCDDYSFYGVTTCAALQRHRDARVDQETVVLARWLLPVLDSKSRQINNLGGAISRELFNWPPCLQIVYFGQSAGRPTRLALPTGSGGRPRTSSTH